MVTSAKRLENDCFLAEAMTKLDSVLKSQEIGSMHDTGCSGLVRWDDPEGWHGEGGSGRGTRVCLWQVHVDVWQNQYNIVK